MKKLFKVIKVFLYIFVIILVLFTIITSKSQNNTIFGHSLYAVLSDSMKPEFQAGDIIISKKVDVNTLEVGDIITYYSNDPSQTVVTHKIVRFEEKNNKTYIVTKGINSQNEDSYLVNPANVLGLYKFSLPKAGFVFQFIRKPLGFILVIIIPLLILLVLSGIRIIKIAKAYKLEAKRVLEEKDALIEEERKKNLEILEEIRILKEQLQNGNNG